MSYHLPHTELRKLNSYVSYVDNLHEKFCMQAEAFSKYVDSQKGAPSEEQYEHFKENLKRMSLNASNIQHGVHEISKYVDTDYQRSLPLKKRALKK